MILELQHGQMEGGGSPNDEDEMQEY